ncbi:hypothetical protein GXW82_23310 [Streptacidiphilus sp. 4-A2]|nr:hypothetical protein [Streptacidiphilus sp. 4-A2]
MSQQRGARLGAAIGTWFTAVTAGPIGHPNSSETLKHLAENPMWEEVRQEVASLASYERRPDLYQRAFTKRRGELIQRQPTLSNHWLLHTSGLAAAAQAASREEDGNRIGIEEVAAEFARFVTDPAPVCEDWLLLDAELPDDCRVPIGEWTLERVTQERLETLRPTGVLGQFRPFELGSEHLQGAAFLHRKTDRHPSRSFFRLPLMHARPHVQYADPQVVMALWSPEPVHLDAIYSREGSQQTVNLHGGVPVEEQSSDGETFWQQRTIGPFEVEDGLAFSIFCDRVGMLMAAARNELTKGKKATARAQRLGLAAEHLVQATHATYGNHTVMDGMVEELVTHYVIALEALLSDGDSGDLARKVIQRTAALHLSDASRVGVAELAGRAYRARSHYAHGSPPPKDNPFGERDLVLLRKLTLQVMLRWLILWKSDETHGAMLDQSLLSRQLHQLHVEKPLRDFYAATRRRASRPTSVEQGLGQA